MSDDCKISKFIDLMLNLQDLIRSPEYQTNDRKLLLLRVCALETAKSAFKAIDELISDNRESIKENASLYLELTKIRKETVELQNTFSEQQNRTFKLVDQVIEQANKKQNEIQKDATERDYLWLTHSNQLFTENKELEIKLKENSSKGAFSTKSNKEKWEQFVLSTVTDFPPLVKNKNSTFDIRKLELYVKNKMLEAEALGIVRNNRDNPISAPLTNVKNKIESAFVSLGIPSPYKKRKKA